MNTKYMKILGVIVVILAIVGGYEFPVQKQSVQQVVVKGINPSGTNYSNAMYDGVTVNLGSAGAGATSTSIYNTDSFDRYVTSIRGACVNVGTSKTAYTGTGLVSLQLTVATTTTANPAVIPGNIAVANAFVLSTSTTNFMFASSTTQVSTTSNAIVWPANTYETFWVNATNTATCTFGLDYVGS